MSRPDPVFMEPVRDGCLLMQASVRIDGVHYFVRQNVSRAMWEDFECRDSLVDQLKRALADEVLRHFSVSVETPTWAT